MMQPLRIVLGWIFTPLFLFLLIITLIIWHPLIAFSRPLNRWLHKNIIEVGNFFLISYIRVTGGSIKVFWSSDAPAAGPVIVVSNHQSYFDIPIFIWVFRRYYAKFVAKQSLGRWLPSISFVLRTGGSALIDRGNARQALQQITALGHCIAEHRCAACIFPEGTRARDGKIRPFRPHGLKALLEAAPGIPVLPVTIDGAWELMRYGLKPVPFGVGVSVRIHSPVSREGLSDDDVINKVEAVIRSSFPAERLVSGKKVPVSSLA